MTDGYTVGRAEVLHDLEIVTADGRRVEVAVTVAPGRCNAFASLTEVRTGRAMKIAFMPVKGCTRKRAMVALRALVHEHGGPEALVERIYNNWRELPWLNPPV
ncbi:MAG: hypothetical protein AB7V08_13995 [Elusimicrobiales bacterium]